MLTNWSRIKTCIIGGVAMFILSVPCALGFNVWSGFVPFASGSGFLDLWDFIVSYVALPLGSLCYVLFVTKKNGWGFDNFLNEVNTGKGMKLGRWIYPYMKYVLPVVIIALFFIGIATFPFADNFTIWDWMKDFGVVPAILLFVAAIFVIWLNYYISKQFERSANQKGYFEKRYFHLCFWTGIIGYLLVISLPDRGNTAK